MDYIQTSNKAADLFGVGAHGFAAGNPAAGQVATYLSPDWCNGVQQELINVITAGGQTPTAGTFDQLLLALQQLFGSGIRYYPAGMALPTADRGPIWSADYNSIMTWQAFTANGAAFEGYASRLIGSLLADTQPTPRTGYVASGRIDLPRAGQYAALRAWAIHNGIMVSSGAWAAGRIACADNPDGTTFRIYDVRGEFPRFWDSGRGVVTQGFGAWLDSQNRRHAHTGRTEEAGFFDMGDGKLIGPLTAGTHEVENGRGDPDYVLWDTPDVPSHRHDFTTDESGGDEARPRSTALLAAIKF